MREYENSTAGIPIADGFGGAHHYPHPALTIAKTCATRQDAITYNSTPSTVQEHRASCSDLRAHRGLIVLFPKFVTP